MRFLFITLLFTTSLNAAPKADLWSLWQIHADEVTFTVDYSGWKQFLDKHLRVDESSINLVDYENVTQADKSALAKVLSGLQQVKVSRLTREQQKAFWINLYNAGTVKVIVDHYPVDSILDIDISPGWLSNGPWGKKLFNIEDAAVSLDDIEHRILRPIWRDPRIHYVLNCASIGCPDLQPAPFTPENMEDRLDQAARGFISHPRGVTLVNGKLTVSSIYIWFKKDFGNTDKNLIDHLIHYAGKDLEERLHKVKDVSDHAYDWSINKL